MTATDSQGISEHRFQAEVSKVLDIVIHSLYSHREIFLRELISNAADAIDKLRFRSVTEHALLGSEPDLEIRLIPDPDGKTLTIADTGVGMTRDELVKNLGTIAHSGSKQFLEALKQQGVGANGPDLIGQFGVGFYSAFIVADRVTVTSRAAGTDETWVWSSDARETFTIEPATAAVPRGTSIQLHLKDDCREYLEEWTLRDLVRKYSDFVSFPIKLQVTREEGEKDARTKTTSFETVNRASALWKRPKSEIKPADYEEFYKHITHDTEGPLDVIHFSIEGTLSYTGLVFIPRRAPFDLFDRDQKKGVRLYVKRVFIMEDCAAVLPEYLRFVRGVIDSDDLPLNVSRELLQEDRVIRAMRGTVTGKVLTALEYLAENKVDDYRTFWGIFGAVLKEGLHFDWDNRQRLAKLARYASSRGDFVSLADYVKNMKDGQDVIYYAFGTTRKAVEGSPHIEKLIKRGYEVIYMTDPIDEWAVEALAEFEGKKLVSAMKEDLDLPADTTEGDQAEDRKAKDAKFASLVDCVEDILEDHVKEVHVSTRLTESPCCLVVPEGGLHAHIERMLRAQGRDVPANKRILEINPDHPVIKKLYDLHEADPTSEQVKEWVALLYDQALLAEGSPVPDPQRFARRISALMSQASG